MGPGQEDDVCRQIQIDSMNAQFSAEFKASIHERVNNGYAPSIAVGVIDSNGVHFYNYGKTKNEKK